VTAIDEQRSNIGREVADSVSACAPYSYVARTRESPSLSVTARVDAG
jgi:hypothetical protein